jgi:hypothetical protein
MRVEGKEVEALLSGVHEVKSKRKDTSAARQCRWESRRLDADR